MSATPKKPLSDEAFDTLFREARTYNWWADKDVPETLIRATYDLMKWGPTSANCSPARFVFVGSKEGKETLHPLLLGSNQTKSMKAPWTVIVATDMRFYDKVPQLFPHAPEAREWFASPEATLDHGARNGSLQGAYLMIAARALGLDCGPMSGFDKDGVKKAFLNGDDETAHWEPNFLCNIGYGDTKDLFPRLPRLSFEEACRIV